MRYAFLVETYATERIKVVSVWSEFSDQDLVVRPRSGDPRGRSVLEQMVHQCVSEDLWFRNMLGIDVGAPPLPKEETRTDFIERYVEDSGKRLAALQKLAAALPEGDKVYAVVPLPPRPIHLLHRGNVEQPREAMSPGALSAVAGLKDASAIAPVKAAAAP